MSHNLAASILRSSKRVVIKIGSVLVTDPETGRVKKDWLRVLANDVSAWIDRGMQPVIVTSGAIALGRSALGLGMDLQKDRMRLEEMQAAAAVGTIALSNAYHEAFNEFGCEVGLVLLSPSQTEERRAHLNARATINTMLEAGIVPVINENDTVATAEIRFGDNDRLSARVTQMVGADTLVLLSTVDGLYTGNPDLSGDVKHVPVLDGLTDEHHAMASDVTRGISTGGMSSKLIAARIAMHAGANMIIADGQHSGCLRRLLSDAEIKCTVFKANDKPMNARKRWIMSHVKSAGRIVIDKGAYRALKNGKSLLPVGVTSVEGVFARGDAVEVVSVDGHIIATGMVGHASDLAIKMCGLHSQEVESLLGYSGREELIHRDNLVLHS